MNKLKRKTLKMPVRYLMNTVLVVLLFVLYFMLIGGREMESYLRKFIPFNRTVTQEFTREVVMSSVRMQSAFPCSRSYRGRSLWSAIGCAVCRGRCFGA